MKRKSWVFILVVSVVVTNGWLISSCSENAAPTLVMTASIHATAQRSLGVLTDSMLPVNPFARDTYPKNCGAAASMKWNFFALYISANEDCTEPVLVTDYGDTPQEFDFVDNPTLFSGSPANGTYKCVVMKVQDILTGTPSAAADAACDDRCAGTERAGDLYREGETPQWKGIDGASIVPTGNEQVPGADTVFIFSSTSPDAAMNGALGVSTNQTLTLLSPLAVPGNVVFYSDLHFQLKTVGDPAVVESTCKLEGGTGWGFR